MRSIVKISAVALLLALIAQDAAAWGPNARRAISLAALQLVRREVPEAFIAGDISYEQNLIQGSMDGAEVLRGDIPLYNDTQTVDAIGSEIQILREARLRGAGSHFAYRMGVLAALVSDVVLPYGFSFNETEAVLQEKIRADLEEHIRKFSYSPSKRTYYYVRSPRLYFEAKRSFYWDDRQLIADEYARGSGYEGFLAQAGPEYFDRAIGAVVDVWYTVFREEGVVTDVKPSARQLSFYYIDEMEYLLDVMESMEYADRAYRVFKEVNPSFWLAYIRIGDLFYAFNTDESRLRAVEEWKIAQRVPGDARHRASERLGKHFIAEGERLFRRSGGPDVRESDLPDALRAFQQALEYDRKNNEAARRITETSVAITERREQFDLQQGFLDYAMKTIKEAERSRLNKPPDFAGAIAAYNQSLNLVEMITTDFKDIYATARDTSSSIRKDVKSVISEVLDAANDAIEKGDQHMLNSNFDEAMKFYGTVESIVNVIPAAPGSIDETRKNDLIDTANGQLRDAEMGKKRLEESQAQQTASPLAALGNN